jgi:apolipoprotein D and lipocalin family protein
MNKKALLLAAVFVFSAYGCTTMPPIETVDRMDLKRFMGDWYVIAAIPTPFEKGVHNGVESYRLAEDGTVETTFTFNKGSFDGPVKTYEPRAFVRDPATNTVWDMQFVWPFKAEYRVVYLDEGYSQTVIGRTKRDYVWIMARAPSIPPDDYARIVRFLAEQGYDISKLQKIPHG